MNKFVIAIFGQDGGPSSSSMAEALTIDCWSSTSVEGQVVRPRPSNGSQGLDLLAGVERSSSPRSKLGGTPRVRRRSVAEALLSSIAFSHYPSGCFL
jgi:hypothetical protein